MAIKAKQYQRPETGRRRHVVLLTAVALACVLMVAGAVIWRNTRPYVPPEFDACAVKGVPEVPEGLGYGTASSPSGDGFSAGFASVWKREADGSLPVWLTNPEGNGAYIMMRITRDSDGKILYESGLLRPGEYLEALRPLMKLASGPIDASAAVYSFDPENYRSLGTFQLPGVVE
jgi:hypothetical protein